MEHTWNVIEVLSSGGANYNWRAYELIGTNNATVTKALTVIAQGTPLFSFWSRGSGNFYGLPKSVSVTCDNGKPYHFWMSAYLTWRLVKMGHTKVGSAAAAYSIFKGYSFLSKSGYRDPITNFTLDSFHGYNNVQRMDMSYSAAGIRFALNILNNTKDDKIDLDNAIIEIFKKSKNNDSMDPDDVRKLLSTSKQQAYLKWMYRFSPDTPYKLLVKN